MSKFKINVVDFTDDNLPLKYTFIYYRKKEDYENDIKSGSYSLNSKFNYLSDK